LLFIIFRKIQGSIAHNVKVVYDVSGVATKKLRSSFSNPSNVAEKKPTKGASPTGFFRSPSRFSGEADTILLYAVCRSYNNNYYINNNN
jgi:hypothetical protein